MCLFPSISKAQEHFLLYFGCQYEQKPSPGGCALELYTKWVTDTSCTVKLLGLSRVQQVAKTYSVARSLPEFCSLPDAAQALWMPMNKIRLYGCVLPPKGFPFIKGLPAWPLCNSCVLFFNIMTSVSLMKCTPTLCFLSEIT